MMLATYKEGVAVTMSACTGQTRSGISMLRVPCVSIGCIAFCIAAVTFSSTAVGEPQLAFSASYATGGYPVSIATGDFNGDGIPDLAIGNAFTSNVSIFIGNGDGTYATRAPLVVGGMPSAVAIADFQHDGKLDLAVADSFGNVVVIFTGNGDGTFVRGATLHAGTAPISIAVGDLDADGNVDLVVANTSSNGNTGQTVTVMLGNGDASFRAPVAYATGQSPYGVVIADFNRDGKPDLAVANGGANNVSILLGNGDGTFRAAVNYGANFFPDGLAAGDFNGDGRLDLAVVNDYSNDVSILLGRGDGTFGTATNFAAGAGPATVSVADFNGDGRPDLVLANRFDDSVSLLLGNGDGTFQAPLVYSVGGQPKAAIAQDLNADGKPDFVVTSATNNNISVYLQAGALPGALTVQSGDNQNATVGALYAALLAAMVRDATGHPLSGIAVTFTAPATGASGTFAGAGTVIHVVSNASGVATTTVLTANAVAGSFVVRATAGSLNASFALSNTALVTQAPAITSGPPPNGSIGAAYLFMLKATGSPAPRFALASGQLPSGLTLDATNGSIAGTPTTPGSFVGVLSATNGISPNATQAFAVTIAIGSQTIAFAPPAAQSVSSVPLILAATASSGLAVTLSSLTPTICAVGGSVAVLRAVGTCTIRASQPGNAMYSAAVSIDQSFAVGKGSQTIAFAPIHDWMLSALPDPLFATSSSGLPVAFSSRTTPVCAVVGNQATLIVPGTCTIRAAQAGNANYYAATSIDLSFSVTGTTRSIAFAPPGDQALSSSPVALSASGASAVPVTFASLTPATCAVTGNLVTLRIVGPCTIRATQAAAGVVPVITADQSFKIVATLPPELPPQLTSGPLVEYATYLGGYGGDSAFDVVVASDGSALVAGSVASSNFPGISSTFFTNAGLDMMFVAKMSPLGGAQDWATIVGGRAPDITGSGIWSYVGAIASGVAQFAGGGQVEAIARDTAGNVYVAAYGDSADFPLRRGTYVRSGAKYIFRVSATGAVQIASAAIDPAVMTIRALAVDAAGAIYFSGVAGPGLLTTPGALLPTMPTPNGALIASSAPYLIKLRAGDGTVAFATYLSRPGARGGTPDLAAPQSRMDAATTAYALAVDGAGNCYLAGQATADQFPVTTGSPDTSDTQHRDAFVAKVNATGTSLLFVARLGGADAERATSIAIAPDGGIVVGGKTATQPFRGTTSSFQSLVTFRPQTPLDERETGFVARLASDGKSWTFIGTLGTDGGSLVEGYDALPLKVAIDGAGAIYVAGTASPYRDLLMQEVRGDVSSGGTVVHIDDIVPLANGLQGVDNIGAFVLKIAGDGSRVVYLAALGGLSVATGLAVDSFSNAYVAGYAPPDLVVANATQAAPMFDGQKRDAFVAKINDHLLPLTLAADRNPASSGQFLNLRASLADARFMGTVEFDDGTMTLGSAVLAGGVATLPATLPVGIHRLRAVFHGNGPFNGSVSPEIIQVVNQALPGP